MRWGAGTLLVVAAGLLVVWSPGLEAGLVGLTLTYTVNSQLSIYLLTRFTAETEKSIVSVERVAEYQQVQPEGEFQVGITSPLNGTVSQ